MVEEREGEVVDIVEDPPNRVIQAQRREDFKKLMEEGPKLCCYIHPYMDRKCHNCNQYMCRTHVRFIGGKWTCERCQKMLLLFPDIVAKDIKIC